MSDMQGALPLSAPALEKHYKEVQTFQEARARSARLLSKGLIVGIVLSMLANVGLAWAVGNRCEPPTSRRGLNYWTLYP